MGELVKQKGVHEFRTYSPSPCGCAVVSGTAHYPYTHVYTHDGFTLLLNPRPSAKDKSVYELGQIPPMMETSTGLSAVSFYELPKKPTAEQVVERFNSKLTNSKMPLAEVVSAALGN